MDDYDIGKAFAKIEHELMASMIRNMKRHRLEEIDENKQWGMWQAEQLKSLEKFKRENRKKYGKRFKDINSSINALIREARAQGGMEQEIQILQAIKKGYKPRGLKKSVQTRGEFFKVNDRKLEALLKAVTDDMEKAETAVLRMSEDQYRKIIFDAQVYANTGAGTYEKAVDMAAKDFLSRGINCIQYANGARHTIAAYADMAIRTAAKRAYLQGEGEMRKEWGISTVIMNKRNNACPLCLPFAGKVMIDDVWSGGSASDGPYPLMSRAVAAGLYHPNCRDIHTTYFEGISTPPDSTFTQEELDQLEESCRNEQKQQYAKRQADRFGRQAEFSLDEENKRKYERKEKVWKKEVERYKNPDIINTRMLSGALNDKNDPFYLKRDAHAKRYYDAVANSDKSSIVKVIAENTGMARKGISKVYDHVFVNQYDLYGGIRKFDPDYDMAESFRRLREGRNIQKHDIIMLKHERLEYELMNKLDMPYERAHELAARKYNYSEALKEYKKGKQG